MLFTEKDILALYQGYIRTHRSQNCIGQRTNLIETSGTAGFNRTIQLIIFINCFHLLFSDVSKEAEHLANKIKELNLEDGLQTAGKVDDLSQAHENIEEKARSWAKIMLNHLPQSRKRPIVKLDPQRQVYAIRTVKKSESYNTLDYSADSYALVALIGNDWLCHRCLHKDFCLHRALFFKCWKSVEHMGDGLLAVADRAMHIYKPQPTMRPSLYMYVNIPHWIDEGNDPTDHIVTFHVTPSKSHDGKMHFKCNCGKPPDRCDHYVQFVNSKFNMSSRSRLQYPEKSEVQTPKPVIVDEFKPISTKPIFLPYDHNEYNTNRSIVDLFVHGKKLRLIPPYDETAKCQHGNTFAPGSPKDDWHMIKGKKKHQPVLIALNAVHIVDVFYRPTLGSCHCKQLYDGKEDAILYVRDNILVTHELMLNFETLLQFNTITLNGYVKSWNGNRNAYVNCYTMSQTTFREAYCSFVKLCRPRDERMLFRCETCEQAPRQTLVCDGIQLGSSA